MSGDLGQDAATAVELWTRRVAGSGAGSAFRHREAGAWRTLSWIDADVIAREIAAGLAGAGLGVGDRVALLSQTRLEWLLTDIGIALAGGIAVPIYASNTADQCAFILRDAGARLAIVEDDVQLEKVASIGGQLPFRPTIVHIAAGGGAAGAKPDAVEAIVSLASLRESGRAWLSQNPGGLAARTAVLAPESPFTIIYTSGTTGAPKGAVLSHRNLTSAIASACRAFALDATDEQLLFLPLAHVLGRELGWVAVQAGFVTSFAESIAKLKDNLVEVRPTFMAGVPRVYEKLYAGVQSALKQGSAVSRRIAAWALGVARRVSAAASSGSPPPSALARAIAGKLVFSKLRKRLGLGRCRFLISGGAPLAPEIAQFFHGVGILILEGYGLTETMSAVFVNRLDRFRFGTVGPALDVVDAKFAADGELLMRGPSVFHEYWNNPAATAEAVDPDGWFHSGDIGQIEDGFLRITDRKKDLIVTAGGKKVAPQPIENAIKTLSPLVSQAVVYGDKRPYCVALLTPSEDAIKRFGNGNGGSLSDSAQLRAELETMIASLNKGLAPYESIKTFAMLPADFTEAAGEITPSLKVRRKVVIDKYASVIDGLYRQARADKSAAPSHD